MEPVIIRRMCAFSPEQLFRVAADIEHYPDFLPNCTHTRVREQDGDKWLVDNVFRWGPVPLNFQTRATMTPPHAIDIRSIKSLGLDFALAWRFEETEGATQVTFEMKLELPSTHLEALARSVLLDQAESTADAFIERTAQMVIADRRDGK
ncbi:type II toxin-antitoxin system RatA family toxin [Pseudomonadota bacterium]